MLKLLKNNISPISKKIVNWHKVERGAPLVNGGNFVRYEECTGYVYDDVGGYTHHEYCGIDTRKALTLFEHDQTRVIPVNPNDKVLIETVNSEHYVIAAKLIDWSSVKRLYF